MFYVVFKSTDFHFKTADLNQTDSSQNLNEFHQFPSVFVRTKRTKNAVCSYDQNILQHISPVQDCSKFERFRKLAVKRTEAESP